MLPRRFAAWLVFLLSAGIAAAQSAGPQVFTVAPSGAKIGGTVEVTIAGANLQEPDSLLFSNPKVKAELVGGAKPVTAAKKAPPKRGKGGAPKATATVKFKVTVPADVPPSVLDVRVVTAAGVSNPRAFVVGRLNDVDEKEPNNDIPLAQSIDLDSTVNGVISAPTDVDYVKFRAKAGQHVIVSCLTTAIDSKLTADLLVATADGKPVAANRGYRGGDAVADFTAPADGEYVVRLAAFAYVSGGTDHFYRLTVSTKPWIDAVYPPLWPTTRVPVTVYGRNLPGAKPDGQILGADGKPLGRLSLPSAGAAPPKVDALATDQVIAPPNAFVDGADLVVPGVDVAACKPLVLLPQATVVLDNGTNDTPETAQPITVPCDVAGRIEKRNDRDWYSFEAKKGDTLTIELFADRLGAPVDSFFVVTDEKGKVLAEVDDASETLSPNQFYTRSEDPGRYRFKAGADGKYRVMASSREAAIQAGVRDVYVLRITKETPDFRLAVMPYTPNLPEGVSLPRGGSVLLVVYADRQDGFNGPITLAVENLPPGVTCPPQVLGPEMTRGTLVLTAGQGAKDWAGFLNVTGTAQVNGKALTHAARPFSVQWPLTGNNNALPNSPVLTRLDRGPGLAVALGGEASFELKPASAAPIKAKAGDKITVALKLTRAEGVKEAVQVLPATMLPGQKPLGNKADAPIVTIDAGKADAKVPVELPATMPPGTYTLVFRGVIPDPTSKGNQVKPPKAMAPSLPVTLEVTAKETPAKKKR